jgi:hypothetical protein
MTKFERRIEEVMALPRAKALRQALEEAVLAYRDYLEKEMGSDVFVTLTPKDAPSDPGTIVRWNQIKRQTH